MQCASEIETVQNSMFMNRPACFAARYGAACSSVELFREDFP